MRAAPRAGGRRSDMGRETRSGSAPGTEADGDATAEVRPPSASPPVAPGPSYEVGARIGRYVVEGALGEGGMGKVYLARDPELARTVALKLVNAPADEGDSTGRRARLQREAQAMAQVSHPNVVPVYDVGTHEGQVFVAMEHVEGETLKAWVQQRPRAWREVVDAFAAAGEGLAAAHARGLVHRDFKPDNVLVGRDGRVRVLDFGLARTTGHQGPEGVPPARPAAPPPSTEGGSGPSLDTSLTADGVVTGTKGYIAPELLRGAPADERSDQFAFGVALHWALFGRLPWLAPTMVDYARAVLLVDPEPAPAGTVPAAVDAVVRRALARDPVQRFPSMPALLQALRSAAGPARRPRWPWAVGAAAGAALAIAVGVRASGSAGGGSATCAAQQGRFAATWSPARRDAVRAAFEKTQAPFAAAALATASSTLDRLATSWEAARLETCRATRELGTQSEEEMLLRMACLERQRAEVGALVSQFEAADRKVVELAAQVVGTLPPAQDCADVRSLSVVARPPADPAVQKEIDELRQELASASAAPSVGRPREAVASYERVVKRAVELGFKPLEADAYYALGLAQTAQGQGLEAVSAFEKALAAAEVGRSDRTALRAVSRLVQLSALAADGEAGRRWGERAKALSEKLGPDPGIDGDIAYFQAFLAMQLGHYDEAVKGFQQALKLRTARYGQDHTETLVVHTNLGAVYDELAMPKEAVEHDLKAIDGFTRALGERHPRLTVPLANLALLYARLGDLPKAAPVGARALDVALAALGPRSHKTGVVHLTLARLRTDEGRAAEGLAEAREAESIFLETAGDKSDTYALALSGQANALLASGQAREALEPAQRAVDVLRATNPDRIELTEALTVLGEAKLALRAPKDALAALDRALEISAAHRRYPGELGRTRLAAARALLAARKDPARARTLAQQARDDLATLPTRSADVERLDRFLAGGVPP